MYIAFVYTMNIHVYSTYIHNQYIQINTWAFPYWPGYHPEIPVLAQDAVNIISTGPYRDPWVVCVS